jgi:hypothetical protein
VHHFILDGAIWLRDGRIASVLLRSAPEVRSAARALVATPRRVATAAAWVALSLYPGAGGAPRRDPPTWQVARRDRAAALAR